MNLLIYFRGGILLDRANTSLLSRLIQLSLYNPPPSLSPVSWGSIDPSLCHWVKDVIKWRQLEDEEGAWPGGISHACFSFRVQGWGRGWTLKFTVTGRGYFLRLLVSPRICPSEIHWPRSYSDDLACGTSATCKAFHSQPTFPTHRVLLPRLQRPLSVDQTGPSRPADSWLHPFAQERLSPLRYLWLSFLHLNIPGQTRCLYDFVPTPKDIGVLCIHLSVTGSFVK